MEEKKASTLEVALAENNPSLSPLAWMPQPNRAERAAVAKHGKTEIVVLWNTKEIGRSIFDAEPSEFVGYEYLKPGYTVMDINHRNANAWSIYANTQGPHHILLSGCCSVTLCGWKVSVHKGEE
jgi:hypothetical protein